MSVIGAEPTMWRLSDPILTYDSRISTHDCCPYYRFADVGIVNLGLRGVTGMEVVVVPNNGRFDGTFDLLYWSNLHMGGKGGQIVFRFSEDNQTFFIYGSMPGDARLRVAIHIVEQSPYRSSVSISGLSENGQMSVYSTAIEQSAVLGKIQLFSAAAIVVVVTTGSLSYSILEARKRRRVALLLGFCVGISVISYEMAKLTLSAIGKFPAWCDILGVQISIEKRVAAMRFADEHNLDLKVLWDWDDELAYSISDESCKNMYRLGHDLGLLLEKLHHSGVSVITAKADTISSRLECLSRKISIFEQPGHRLARHFSCELMHYRKIDMPAEIRNQLSIDISNEIADLWKQVTSRPLVKSRPEDLV
jgi:hypothetical protein